MEWYYKGPLEPSTSLIWLCPIGYGKFECRIYGSNGWQPLTTEGASADYREVRARLDNKVNIEPGKCMISAELLDKLEGLETESYEITNTTALAFYAHTKDLNNPHKVSKSQLGLDNVDNTSDAQKPISQATQAALNQKVNCTTQINDYSLTGDVTLTKGDVGLSNVDNTSDINKPVSTPQQAALDLKLDKATVKQVTGASVTDVISQKTVTDALATKADHGYPSSPKTLKDVEDLKENSANKQNSLDEDGTGTRFPTVDAINAGLAEKQPTLVSGTNIKTLNGESLLGSGDLAVSGGSDNLIASYTLSENREVVVESIDYTTYIFTSTAHGLINGDVIVPALNLNTTVFARDVMPINVLQVATTFKVVEVTANTFKITKDDVVVQPVSQTTVDFTKWHFERTPPLFTSLSITNLPTTLKRCRVEVTQYSANMCYYRCTPSALTYFGSTGEIKLLDTSVCLNAAYYEVIIDIIAKTVVGRGNFYRQRLATSSYDAQVISFAGYVPASSLRYIPDIRLHFGYTAGALNGTSMKIYKL